MSHTMLIPFVIKVSALGYFHICYITYNIYVHNNMLSNKYLYENYICVITY